MAGGARVDAFILDLDTRAGLSIARSFGRAGLSIDLGARDAHASGLRTRYAAERAVLPEPELDFDAYASAVVDWVRERPAGAVLATIDSSVEVLHLRRDEIGRHAAPGIGSVDAVEIALSKPRTLALAGELGVPVPRSYPCSTIADVEAAASELDAPCVLKPATSWTSVGDGGERLAPLFASDATEAALLFARLGHGGGEVLVQELVSGERETIKLFRVGGRVVARLAMSIDRAWPPLGGSSVMRRTISPPGDTLALAERLVGAIGLDGYSEVEFRRDTAGRPLLMEVNPRLSQSVEVAIRAGVDFPRMQLEWARGGRVPEPPAPTIGLRVGWLAGDLRLLVGSLAGSPPPRPRFASTARSIAADYLLRRARIEGLDLRDRRPTVAAASFAVRGLARGRSR